MIDNYDSFTHNLVAYFRELGCDIQVVRADALEHNVFAHNLDQSRFEGIVVSPGPKSPYECLACNRAVAQALGKAPVLGVCLGHQIIARLLGATIEQGKRPMHGKITPIATDGAGLLETFRLASK